MRKIFDSIEMIFFSNDLEALTFDQFCDILIPVITGSENDSPDDYAIWLAFQAFDRNHDQYIQADELEILMHIIGKSISRERIRDLIDRVDWDQNGQLDFHEFRQFIIRGYARELLMMDITKEIIYSKDILQIPTRYENRLLDNLTISFLLLTSKYSIPHTHTHTHSKKII